MKRVYLDQFSSQLRTAIPDAFPGYELFRPGKARGGRGNLERSDVLFMNGTVEGVSTFLLFSPHPRQEEFGAEIGWSTLGRYPAQLERPSASPSPAGVEFSNEEAIVGFYSLYPQVRGKSHLGWKVWQCSVGIDHPEFREIFVNEDSLPVSDGLASERMHAAIGQCVSDLSAVAMPYLSRLIEAKQMGAVP